MATDEAFSSQNPEHGLRGLSYILGTINADNIGNYSMNIWSSMYKVIRKMQLSYWHAKERLALNTIQDEEITGYTRMMRGYAYYNLIQSYGPCIILGDDLLPNNELPETYNYSRSTYDECVDYCCNELELAAKYMPIDLNPTFFGRPSRGAAFAFESLRLRLQQASPLYNGGQAARTAFGNWKRTVDGANYVNLNCDETRWAVAAAACKRVIEMNKYKFAYFSHRSKHASPSIAGFRDNH